MYVCDHECTVRVQQMHDFCSTRASACIPTPGVARLEVNRRALGQVHQLHQLTIHAPLHCGLAHTTSVTISVVVCGRVSEQSSPAGEAATCRVHHLPAQVGFDAEHAT